MSLAPLRLVSLLGSWALAGWVLVSDQRPVGATRHAPAAPEAFETVTGATPAACDTSAAVLQALGLPNLWADRTRENRFRLPWTSTAAPRVVTDPAICRRAARAYLRDSLHRLPDSTLHAQVATAGGLYFVRAAPVERLGEFRLTAVLDSAFRWLVGLTG